MRAVMKQKMLPAHENQSSSIRVFYANSTLHNGDADRLRDDAVLIRRRSNRRGDGDVENTLNSTLLNTPIGYGPQSA